MQIIKDDWLDILQATIPLKDKNILEVGCGSGSVSHQLSKLCGKVTALDCDDQALEVAKRFHYRPNIEYLEGVAQALPFADKVFDSVLFSNSFHHIPTSEQATAIREAVRVLKNEGELIILEPGFSGSLFEAETQFQAEDGDERIAKSVAYGALLSSSNLKEVGEYYAEKIVSFDSTVDFIETLKPRCGDVMDINKFLQSHRFHLRAEKRVNIFVFSTSADN